ncbi:RidA family protein [Glutamicibacter arilaitensis]|uniref:RidA family protein n=1 Tax=Glutamicibacter arilaitensis TaxID=256701 RepID=UPI00384E51B7
MASIEFIRPAGLVHSPAFSHVAVVPPGAKMIYLGGQNSVDEQGQLIGADDVAAQSVRALHNARLALNAAGADLADVISWNVLLAQGVDVPRAYGAIAGELSSPNPPLVSASFVFGLGVPGALVEISAVAALFD